MEYKQNISHSQHTLNSYNKSNINSLHLGNSPYFDELNSWQYFRKNIYQKHQPVNETFSYS
jgi:hypothetical protein